jgi:hypothetical protein
MNTTKSTNNIAQAPEQEGKHLHKCIKCAVDYVHYHVFKNANHPQFSFQCPNPACEWHFEKGKSTKPSTPRPDSPSDTVVTERGPKSETYRERSVRIAFKDGLLKCGKTEHFVMKSNGGQYKVPVRVPAQQLLAAMPLGADARCDCERLACMEAWTWNRPGVYETDWVQPGSYHKGFGKYDPAATPRRVMPLDFHLKKDQVTYLHERNPGWLFVTVGTNFHDHPVAHAQTQLATFNLFHSLKAGKYIDLHGNPAHCDRLNAEMKDKTFTAMCNVESSDDVVRKRTKWGPKKVGNKTRWIESALRDISTPVPANGLDTPSPSAIERNEGVELLREANGLTSVHTLYYYEPSELAHVINATKGKMMVAMMHRFVGEEGTMNNGEQKWRRYRDEQGRSRICQTNVLTNKKYDHADNERWFQNYSWSPYRGEEVAGHLDEEVALVWDANVLADGVYVMRITTATVREALLDTTYVEPTVKKVVTNSTEYIAKYNKVVIAHPMSGPEEVVIPHAYHKLFNELRLKMVSATIRDSAKYKAHAQYVALKTKGVMAVENVDDVQVIYDLVYASFWVDAKRDRSLTGLAGHDIRKHIVDAIITATTTKSFAAGATEILRGIRHRL